MRLITLKASQSFCFLDLIVLTELVADGLADLELRDRRFDFGFQLFVPVAITALILSERERLGGIPTEPRAVCLQFGRLPVFRFSSQALYVGCYSIACLCRTSRCTNALPWVRCKSSTDSTQTGYGRRCLWRCEMILRRPCVPLRHDGSASFARQNACRSYQIKKLKAYLTLSVYLPQRLGAFLRFRSRSALECGSAIRDCIAAK